jgi:purine-binding chemotaxis protein CheW
MTTATRTEQVQHCTFHLGELYLGVEVTQVQEVIRHQATTPVPLAPDVIGGLMNLRGEIVTTIDLRRRLDLPPLEDGHDPMHVVIRSDDAVVSLLVDGIGDVIEVDDDAFEPAPPTLPSGTRDLIVGVYKLDGRLLLVLDCDRVLDLSLVSSEVS